MPGPLAMMAASKAADGVTQNPTVMLFTLCIVMMIVLTPPCILCSCCCFITKSIWMPDPDDD